MTWYRSKTVRLLLLLGVMEFSLVSCEGSNVGAQQQIAQQRLVHSSVALPESANNFPDASFAALSGALSESAGYFDTDNLISNETGYLHVLNALDRLGVQGGAYIGVGPGQNFSYIARIRPRVAFVVDIRQDNLLEHLLFKALFELSETRVEYLALLLGKSIPEDLDAWRYVGVDDLIEYIDQAEPNPEAAARARMLVRKAVQENGFMLEPTDLDAVDRIHSAFIRSGLDLRFTSYNRPPQWYYPTLRQLLAERDLSGTQSNYLAREEDFLFLKSLQEDNKVIPVVGDLGGDFALKAIGEVLKHIGEDVTALYASNVEFYLWQSGTFPGFVENMSSLPWSRDGVVIRSYFSNFQPHPMSVQGYVSSQLLQHVESFLRRALGPGYRDYWELVTHEAVSLR